MNKWNEYVRRIEEDIQETVEHRHTEVGVVVLDDTYNEMMEAFKDMGWLVVSKMSGYARKALVYCYVEYCNPLSTISPFAGMKLDRVYIVGAEESNIDKQLYASLNKQGSVTIL